MISSKLSKTREKCQSVGQHWNNRLSLHLRSHFLMLLLPPISSKVFPLSFFNDIHVPRFPQHIVTQFVFAMPTSIISTRGTWNTLYLFGNAIKNNQTNKKPQLEAGDKFCYHRTQINFTDYSKWKAERNLPQYLQWVSGKERNISVLGIWFKFL